MKKIIKFTCVMIVASVVSLSVEAKKMPMAKKEVTSLKKIRVTKKLVFTKKKEESLADCWYDACGHVLGCCVAGVEQTVSPAPVCNK